MVTATPVYGYYSTSLWLLLFQFINTSVLVYVYYIALLAFLTLVKIKIR